MKKTVYTFTSLGLLLLPLVAGAQNINSFLDNITSIMDRIVTFLIAVATLIFIFGIVKYIAAGGDSDATKEARGYIIFAIIGLVMIVGLWGFVNIVLGSLNLNTQVQRVNLPRN